MLLVCCSTDFKRGEGSQFECIFLNVCYQKFRLGDPILFYLKAGNFHVVQFQFDPIFTTLILKILKDNERRVSIVQCCLTIKNVIVQVFTSVRTPLFLFNYKRLPSMKKLT